MTLPEIPGEAVRAAWSVHIDKCGSASPTVDMLAAAWPALYAAALRHAADEVEDLPWHMSGPATFAQHLRTRADEATP